MNQIERLIDLRSSKLSNGNQQTTNTVDIKNKASDVNQMSSSHYHPKQQHFVYSLAEQQHLQSYLPYHHHRSSFPIHHQHPLHSSIHSTNGHSPNASCMGGSTASAAAARTSTSSMSHSPSRFSPITFHHCNNVPTAQVISAKMLLLEQQRQQQSPPNRVHHIRQQHIPEASSFFARCSQPSVAHNHLHDSSNTSTFSSSLGGNNSNNHFDGNIFKSKLINLNCLSEGTFSSTLLTSSNEQSSLIFDDEDRENMAPGAANVFLGEGNSSEHSLLLSTEDLSELSDDEDGNLHEFY